MTDGIEFELDHFGVAGLAGADLLVAGIGDRAAGKAGNDRFDAGDALENGLGAPKTAAAEGCGFEFRRGVGWFWRGIHMGNRAKATQQQAGPLQTSGQATGHRQDLRLSHANRDQYALPAARFQPNPCGNRRGSFLNLEDYAGQSGVRGLLWKSLTDESAETASQ